MARAWPRVTATGLVVAWLTALQLAPPAAAQQSFPADAPDSIAVHRAAARAQARFESVRRSRLPYAASSSGGGCETRVGRLCYWYDPHEAANQQPEPSSIARARADLLADLSRAREASPRDGWIAGQRVRYLVEAGHADSARLEAESCDAERWWCAALMGFAAHAAHDRAADSIFLAALALAPDAVRCEWTDLSVLLPRELRRRYKELGCGADRDSANAVLWWLAHPLHARSGNDVRAEHHARLTMVRLQADARNPFGMRWGDDMRELVVRYGWSRTFTRTRPRLNETTPLITGREPAPSFSFIPHARALREPLLAETDDWQFEAPVAPVRHSPAWADRMLPLPVQLAVLRRGDSALVIGAWTAPHRPDVTPRWWAGLAASTAPETRPASDTLRTDEQRGWLAANAPLAPLLVSVELVEEPGDSARRAAPGGDTLVAARWRQGIVPPGANDLGRLTLSAPIILEPPPDFAEMGSVGPEATLDEVLPRMLGGTTLRAPGRVGIFWETYGLPSGRSPVHVRLSLQGGDRSWLRRLGDRITGRTLASPPLMSWTDILTVPDGSAQPDASIVGRQVTLDLPSLAPGMYALEVEVSLPDGTTAASRRLIEIRRP